MIGHCWGTQDLQRDDTDPRPSAGTGHWPVRPQQPVWSDTGIRDGTGATLLSSEACKSGGGASICRIEHPGCTCTPAPRTCSSCSGGSLIPGALTSQPHIHGYCRRLNGLSKQEAGLSARIAGGGLTTSQLSPSLVCTAQGSKVAGVPRCCRLVAKLPGRQTTRGSRICNREPPHLR